MIVKRSKAQDFCVTYLADLRGFCTVHESNASRSTGNNISVRPVKEILFDPQGAEGWFELIHILTSYRFTRNASVPCGLITVIIGASRRRPGVI